MQYGIDAWLKRKYDLLAQQADADTLRSGADANLNNVRAGLLPAESAANIDLTGAQAGLARSNAANVDETTKFVAPIARANIFNTRAQGGLYGQQAAGEYQLNRMSPRAGAAGARRGMPAYGEDFNAMLKSIMREGLGYK